MCIVRDSGWGRASAPRRAVSGLGSALWPCRCAELRMTVDQILERGDTTPLHLEGKRGPKDGGTLDSSRTGPHPGCPRLVPLAKSGLPAPNHTPAAAGAKGAGRSSRVQAHPCGGRVRAERSCLRTEFHMGCCQMWSRVARSMCAACLSRALMRRVVNVQSNTT